MRTAGLYFCHGPEKIYGIQVVLEHDIDKDPDYTQIKGNDNLYYETKIGSKTGKCDLVSIEKGSWIQTITVRHDGLVIRSIEIISSDGKVTTFGRTESDKGYEKLTVETIKLGMN